MRKSKNRYFYHILVSPGDAPGAITLNVVRMEREYMFIRFAMIHERDRQTDGQTDGHRVTAYTALMHTHRAVINGRTVSPQYKMHIQKCKVNMPQN